MSKVTGLRGVVLETPEFHASVRFYESVWGLYPLDGQQDDRRYFYARGGEPWVLGLVRGTQRKLLTVRLAMASPGDVDAVYDRLCVDRVPVLDAPAMIEGPGGYYGFSLKDPDGRIVELSACTPVERSGAATHPAAIRVSHLVLNSPQARSVSHFYTRHLGFEISDWYEQDAIIFLRCNADHHCLGIGQGSNAALNHIAFLVDNGEAVKQTAAQAIERGCVPIWGPGRHGPGGNAFCYFQDPAGFVVEYTAELIQISSEMNWRATEWPRTPESANVEGTGGPTPTAIRLMSGES